MPPTPSDRQRIKPLFDLNCATFIYLGTQKCETDVGTIEAEGLFIMGWMGKEKKVAQRRRPSVNRRLVWALFFSHPRLLLPLLILYACASWWARAIDRSHTCTHTGRDARRQGAGSFLFWTRPGRGDVFALRLLFPGKQTKTRTWRHFNSPVLF